jgi:dethiobiotin synthetase
LTKGLFISGTDTGVGKTIVVGGLARALNERGVHAGVMKPVASGSHTIDGKQISEDADFLKRVSGVNDALDLINPYALTAPLVPSAAARMEKVVIDFEKIKRCYEKLSKEYELMLVEGVGGLLAPLNDKEVVADLIKLLNIPVLIVVGSKLGAINHTLLTITCVKALGIEVVGIILNHVEPVSDDVIKSNREALINFTDIPILGEIPYGGTRQSGPKGEEALVKSVGDNIEIERLLKVVNL